MHQDIYECSLYQPWSAEFVQGECPHTGHPKIDVAKAKQVMDSDELIELLRSWS